MDTSKVFKILNLYTFVKTEDDKADPKYVDQRLWEHKLMQRQRNAVSFCKKLNGINTFDVSKITNEDKDSIESCLKENFLKDDAEYFGSRDVIYLDLHNYE